MKPFYTDWEEFNDGNRCNSWVATAVVGSAVIGAGSQIYGANKAANAQQQAVADANEIQRHNFEVIRTQLEPYRNMGEVASKDLMERLPFLTSPIDVTAELQNPESTAAKAYDFTRTQGLKATQNSAAARGLGVSGAALKGAANFATGLADNTYTNLFNLENTNRTNAYNRLKGLVDTGQNAAAQTGSAGTAAANAMSANTIGGGNAAAAAANATGSAIGKMASDIGGYAAYKGLYGGSSPASNYEYTLDPSGVPVGRFK